MAIPKENPMTTNFLTPDGVAVQGPYSPAVEVRGDGITSLYVSGQGTHEPSTGEKYLGGDIGRQASLSLDNLDRVLTGCGYSRNDVVKVTIFATDPSHAAAINESYRGYFGASASLPARTTVFVASLPGGMAVEMEAIAVRKA
jgi:2-iminobutanoate/2-iminopropanoate deaminase